MAKTSIEWADYTWNPVTGCDEVSEGCQNCYAKTFAERWRGVEGHYFENGFDIEVRPDKLEQPLRWRKPRRIFVNSMSDLFHDSVSDRYIGAVFAVMALAPHHTFQLLTKRHARMRSLVRDDLYDLMVREISAGISDEIDSLIRFGGLDATRKITWPLQNVWLGVSAENQQWANIRIPALLDTPAAVRFVSAEPLLGPIDLAATAGPNIGGLPKIDWVIAGGESGHGARPMNPAWVRQIRDDCDDAGVAFLFKQWGEWAPAENPECDNHMRKLGKKAAGRELDGRTWDQYPEKVLA